MTRITFTEIAEITVILSFVGLCVTGLWLLMKIL